MVKLSHIALELTDQCNLACKFCYNIWKIPGSKRKSFNSYEKATKTLAKLFMQATVKNVTLTGGEPFMSERIKEIALYCRMQGKSVTIISNGSKASIEDYNDLIKMGITLFELPIHSYKEETHDLITNIQGSWKKSIRSIIYIQQLQGNPVPVIVLTKYNISDLSKTLDFINSLGLKRIMLNRYNIGGNGVSDPSFVSATHSQLKAGFRIANEKAKHLDLLISSNVCSPDCLLDPKEYPYVAFGHCSKDILSKPITMDINGNIRLCNHSPIIAGNIFTQPLQEILSSSYASSWNKIKPNYCNTCSKWETCRGGCRAASEQCGFDLDQVDPILTSEQLID